ncbi:MAG: transglycosylase SLT domain-containing protein [Desulfatitalea sp.]|nr:transglycosylase SLT domain-containing protein [Desulfatitalea sp.]NNK02508.1 transglycosylase SLT domain-containing protein [Desulfatitalea sp.]
MINIRQLLIVGCLVLASLPARAQSLIDAKDVRPPEQLSLCGEPVPVAVADVRERFEKEMLLSLWDRPQVLLWLKRSTRYLPFIAQELERAGLPEDLKYLAIVESALRPHAGSSRGAIGFWQLMPETGRRYGLQVDEFVDQRRDIFASTQAAMKYLKELHQQFGKWALAMAAYNMGEEGLAAEVIEQKTNDYYRLYLPLETQRFVFRMMAVKLIMENAGRYGFSLSEKDYYPPLRFDTVAVDCFQSIPLRILAEAAGVAFKQIKDLNPHIRGHYIQAGNHQIRLPQGSARRFESNFKAMVEQHDRERSQRIYVVQSGDSLSSIADKFNVPLAALLIWNRIDLNKTLYPGDRLVIYPRQKKPVPAVP